jgi:hypothetical protein
MEAADYVEGLYVAEGPHQPGISFQSNALENESHTQCNENDLSLMSPE